MSKFLIFLGLCLLAGLAYFFSESSRSGRGPGPEVLTGEYAREAQSKSNAPKPSNTAQRGDPAELLLPDDSAGQADPGARTELAKTKGARRKPNNNAGLRSIKGTLVANGMPQGGGQLVLYSGSRLLGRAESNRKGEFELAYPVPAEQLVLQVSTRGFALFERDLGDQHQPGTDLLGNLFLETGSVLTGEVLDQAGLPVAGAEVVLSQITHRAMYPNLGEHARTRSDGSFQFASAPSSKVTLTAIAPGFELKKLSHFHTPGKALRIQLRPGTSLSVNVIDLDGKPVPDSRLSLRSNSGEQEPRQAISDELGIARFDNIPDQEWSLHAITKGYRPGIVPSIPKSKREVELKLVAWPRARGKLEAPRGATLPAGTEVHAVLNSQRGDLTGRLPRGTPVAEDGSYELIDLRAGLYRVRANAPGFALTNSELFQVVEGADVQVPSFTLQRGGKLSLTIRAGGKPAAGVSAEVLAQQPREAQLWSEPMAPADQLVHSDGSGLLRLEGQTPGDLWLILRGAGVVPMMLGPLSIQNEGENNLTVQPNMTLAGSIKGRLRAESGASLGLGRVRLLGGNIRVPAQTTDQNGRFGFSNIPPGSYTILPSGTLAGRMLEGAPQAVQVTSGKETEVMLTIESE